LAISYLNWEDEIKEKKRIASCVDGAIGSWDFPASARLPLLAQKAREKWGTR
jgi:hypothetical protein